MQCLQISDPQDVLVSSERCPEQVISARCLIPLFPTQGWLIVVNQPGGGYAGNVAMMTALQLHQLMQRFRATLALMGAC